MWGGVGRGVPTVFVQVEAARGSTPAFRSNKNRRGGPPGEQQPRRELFWQTRVGLGGA